ADDRVVLVLQPRPVLDGAEIVPNVQLAGGLYPAEDSRHSAVERESGIGNRESTAESGINSNGSTAIVSNFPGVDSLFPIPDSRFPTPTCPVLSSPPAAPLQPPPPTSSADA